MILTHSSARVALAAALASGTLAAVLAAPVAAQSGPTVLGRPYYDAKDQALVVPYRGAEPAFQRGKLVLPPRVYFDFEATLAGPGVLNSPVAGHATLLGWGMARRDKTKTRITLIFRRQTAVSVTLDPTRHALLLVPNQSFEPTPTPPSTRPVTPSPRPLPSPAATPTLAPSPAATPAAWPTPEATLAPEPSPSLTLFPTPEPTPTPTPTPQPTPIPTPVPTPTPQAPPLTSLAVAVPWLSYEESYQAASVATRADAVRAMGVRLGLGEAGRTGFAGMLEATALASAYTDTGTPYSLHARQEWRLEAALAKELTWGALGYHVGVGYLTRYETAQHAVTLPQTGYAYSPWRLLHGPEAVLGARLPLVGATGWNLNVAGALAPYVFSALPTGTTPLPALIAHRLEVTLEAPVGPLSLGLGYRRWGLTGDGYAEVFQGPLLTLGGSY